MPRNHRTTPHRDHRLALQATADEASYVQEQAWMSRTSVSNWLHERLKESGVFGPEETKQHTEPESEIDPVIDALAFAD